MTRMLLILTLPAIDEAEPLAAAADWPLRNPSALGTERVRRERYGTSPRGLLKAIRQGRCGSTPRRWC